MAGDADLRVEGSYGEQFVHPELGGAAAALAMAREAEPPTKVCK